MKINYKNIIVFFLLIIGLVIFSHSIIPHNHHYNNAVATKHNEHNEDKSANTHCHYLNDIIISNITLSVNYLFKQTLKNIGYISDLEIDYRKNTFLKAILYSDFIFPEYFAFLETSPTRGSPLS